MTELGTVQDIEKAVRQLSSEDLAAFRKWFADFDAKLWDQQVAEDVDGGRLDFLPEEALQDLRAGRTTKL